LRLPRITNLVRDRKLLRCGPSPTSAKTGQMWGTLNSFILNFRANRSESFTARIGARGILVAVLVFLMLCATGDAATGTRFNDLGHKLMCTCGCGQVLLECNHVGCQSSDRMRHELQARIDAGDSDDTILQWFVTKYGTTVLAAPTGHGFNRVAWVMPYVAFAFGIALCVFVVRSWNRRAKPAVAGAGSDAVHTAQLDEMRRRAREDTEI
jgi:cytochrome c-type biogenesis protein CcmH